jgi:hypothetical protein
VSHYTVDLYDGSQHPPQRPVAHAVFDTEREARREAASMLGHETLRGAARWDHHGGGTVYQFGPGAVENGYDFVVIREVTP